MSTNKHASLRYQILDRCFRDFSKFYSFEQLLDKVNDELFYTNGCKISERQLRDDINYMKGGPQYYAPIKAHRIFQDGAPFYYYRYTDPEFSIIKNELSDEDLRKLRSTIEMLGKFRGGPANAWLEEVITNLECRFGLVANNEKIVSFEQNKKLQGLEFLPEIIDSAIDHRAIFVEYKDMDGNEMNGVIHPYHVKQYNNRWFLFGKFEVSGRLVNRALDRIVRIGKTDVEFCPNTQYDFEHYFDNVIGVSVPYKDTASEPIEILLKFDPVSFKYVASKPMHRTQDIVSKRDCIIKLNVIPNHELQQNIFSYLPNVEVLSPQSYREEIMKKLEENLKKYTAVQKDCIPE